MNLFSIAFSIFSDVGLTSLNGTIPSRIALLSMLTMLCVCVSVGSPPAMVLLTLSDAQTLAQLPIERYYPRFYWELAKTCAPVRFPL